MQCQDARLKPLYQPDDFPNEILRQNHYVGHLKSGGLRPRGKEGSYGGEGGKEVFAKSYRDNNFVAFLSHLLYWRMHNHFVIKQTSCKQILNPCQKCTTKCCDNLRSLRARHERRNDIIFGTCAGDISSSLNQA